MKNAILSFTLIFLLSNITYANDDDKVKVRNPNLNQKYEGECKRGLAHGKGKAWGKEDYYEGSFKKGRPHGYGIYKWANESVYKGNFVRGKMKGKGELIIVIASEKKYSYEGEFKKDLMHGYGVLKWVNGSTYKGYFVKGEMNGKGKLTIVLPSGKEEICEGYFEKNKYIGKYKSNNYLEGGLPPLQNNHIGSYGGGCGTGG
jgi:hypothetical protein